MKLEHRTHPLAWGYVACPGGSRVITKAELAELSTKQGPTLPWNRSYPQPGASSAPPPVDKQ